MKRALISFLLIFLTGTAFTQTPGEWVEPVGFYSYQAAQGYYLSLSILSRSMLDGSADTENVKNLAHNIAAAMKRCEDTSKILEKRLSGSAAESARELSELFAELKTFAQALIAYAETPNSDLESLLKKHQTLSQDKIERFGQPELE